MIMLRIHEMFRRIVWSKLLRLNREQSILFHRYCKLVTQSFGDLDAIEKAIEQGEEIERIWEQALDDQHLADCLELIDYFVGSKSLDTNSNESKYFTEYLQKELEKLIAESEKEDLLKQEQNLLTIERGHYFHECREIAEKMMNESEKESLLSNQGGLNVLMKEQDILSLEYGNEIPPIEIIISMVKLRIKEMRETAAELLTEAVINII
jgi:hypothetical protein